MFVFVLAVSTALCFSFLCSIFESVLLSVRPVQIEAMIQRGSKAGHALRRFKRDIERPIAAILILNTLAHTVGATLAGSSYEDAIGSADTLWLFSLVFTMAVLIFTEIIPKTLGVTFVARLATPVTHAVRVLVWVLSPAVWLTSKMSNLLTRGKEKRPVTSVEEIRLLAALGRSEGAVGQRVADVIQGVASLRELTAYDVMVPRGAVAYLSSTRSLEENLALIRSTGHSRFPFSPTDDLDDVKAVVLAKELFFHVHDNPDDPQDVDWDAFVKDRKLLVVPETTTLDRVLRLFQDSHQHLAIVVDEYGGTQGVVTLEDVLEEIVGEIEDETDRAEKLIDHRPEGRLVCRGWAETRKVFKELGVDDKVEFVTVSGFVADQLGRVPAQGDSIRWRPSSWPSGRKELLQFDVLKASTRRAERIQIITVADDVAPPEDSSPTAADGNTAPEEE